tara:strand:- start:680 stop:865 length:186 start_codon:yes stop_codon:yes gene_type:complete
VLTREFHYMSAGLRRLIASEIENGDKRTAPYGFVAGDIGHIADDKMARHDGYLVPIIKEFS